MVPITVWYILSRIGLVNLALFIFIHPLISFLVIVGEFIYAFKSPYIFEILIANIVLYNTAQVIKFIFKLIQGEK